MLIDFFFELARRRAGHAQGVPDPARGAAEARDRRQPRRLLLSGARLPGEGRIALRSLRPGVRAPTSRASSALPPDLLAQIPEEWLRGWASCCCREEEKALIQSLGGWEKLMETLRQRLRGAEGAPRGRLEVDRHRAAPRRSAPTATTPRACASARTARATAARSRSGTSASFATSTTRSSSARATSRSRCGGCAASRARARRRSWTSTTRSARPRATPAGSI